MHLHVPFFLLWQSNLESFPSRKKNCWIALIIISLKKNCWWNVQWAVYCSMVDNFVVMWRRTTWLLEQMVTLAHNKLHLIALHLYLIYLYLCAFQYNITSAWLKKEFGWKVVIFWITHYGWKDGFFYFVPSILWRTIFDLLFTRELTNRNF